MNTRALILTLSFLSLLLSQSNPILPGQRTAIRTLATSAGFSPQELEERIQQDYGLKLDALSQIQGAELIRSFQSGSISKVPLAAMSDAGKQKTSQQDLVPILEKGMEKRFHFKDGSVREGKIVTVSDGLVTLKTTSGSFTIPEHEFLAETADIKNKNGETFTGVVMGETTEEFIIRTKYGDAIVQKKDINKMFAQDQYILRFNARLWSQIKDFNEKTFIVSFYCGDDTVQVYETSQRNSGVM